MKRKTTDVCSYRHLDIEKRMIIEQGLNEGKTLTAIARQAGVSVSSIRRELLRNRRSDGASYAKSKDTTNCAHLRACKMRSICEDYFCEKRLCKRCSMRRCQDICPEYELRRCATVEKAPFVCNACEHYGQCTLSRYRYCAQSAQSQSMRRSKDSRSGIDMTQDEVDELVLAVRDGLSKGQSIHHLFATHDMPCSERSFYRYVERQDIPIKSIDLAKKVKYKKRHKAKIDIHASGFYNGHEYEDFLLLEDDERASVTEVDTVWGTRSDRKCILSLHRVDLHFQLYMLLERRDTAHVVAALDLLEKCCDGKFREFFGLLLLDRGVEFDDISGIESSMAGGVRCAAYFADPNRPDQKGACEKNHVELRKILPKGTSLANMDMATLALICSHVNSSVRKGLGDTTPMQMAMAVLPKCIFDALGLFLIPPTDVIGAPNILYRP